MTTWDAPPTFGGFWRRLAAFVVDAFLLGTVEAGLAFLVLAMNSSSVSVWQVVLVSGAISWAYFSLFESSPAQATVGKLAFGIKVVHTDGGPISFRRATMRFWLKSLSTLTFGIGWLLAAVTPRRQALHDILCGTLVMRAVDPKAANKHWDPRIQGFREHWDGTRWVREEGL